MNPEWLEPVGPGAILERMLNNLTEAYRREAENAARVFSRPEWITACVGELQARQT